MLNHYSQGSEAGHDISKQNKKVKAFNHEVWGSMIGSSSESLKIWRA